MTEWMSLIGRPGCARTANVRPRRRQWTAALLLGLGLAVLPLQRVTAVDAESQAGGLPALEKRVVQLEATAVDQATKLAALEAQSTNQGTQIAALQAAVTTQAAQIAALLNQITTQGGQITALETAATSQGGQISTVQATLGTLTTQLLAVADKLLHVTRFGNDLVINGANLHIRNGLGSTDTINTVGNLIIGYNELPAEPFSRAGSHNLIVGARHSWSLYGGLVAGSSNSIFGPYASVSGGSGNTAYGRGSSVCGGVFNLAFGAFSTVGGGNSLVENDDLGWEAD
jgi:uncharacterized coiled-coil protein SlyX